jgi:S1-C subfamily serine protease
VENNLEIFIWRQGRQEGPISVRALEGAVRLGGISPGTPAWTRNHPEWKTAAEILKAYPCDMGDQIRVQPGLPVARTPDVVRKEIKKPAKSQSPRWAVGIGLAFTCGLILLLVASRQNNGRVTNTDISDRGEARPAPTENENYPNNSNEPARIARNATSIADSERCVLMARNEESSGTAFIAMENGRAYVYTNVHVASARNLKFTDFRGAPIQVNPRGEVVGVSNSSTAEELGTDIVRFPLIEPPRLSLVFANRTLIEQKPEVWTLGDSGGESILKTLKGQIKGVGPAKIEVDCEFIKGNSGGPIVTADGHVVGIASYITTNQSILAKGTEQEIRRIGWIPGKKFHWHPTSADNLADERSMVTNCMLTTDLLIVISMLEAGKAGFELPKDWPSEANEVIAMAANHPLNAGIEETNRTILSLSKKGNVPQAVSHREYLRFFNSCVHYQKSQLEKTEQEIKSSFWRSQLDFRIQYYLDNLEHFQSQLRRFDESGGINKSLSES